MSSFDILLLPKISNISSCLLNYFDQQNNNLKKALDDIEKFGQDYKRKSKKRETTQKPKNAPTILQSITEDEDVSNQKTERRKRNSKSKSTDSVKTASDNEPVAEVAPKPRVTKKRSKDEVEGMSSPEQDKRPKRNASVKAQSVISKQVNVNLSVKLRREKSGDKTDTAKEAKDDSDKENSEPVVKVKQEKISLPPEPMDCETLPLNVEIKSEVDDEVAMPPPVAPLPRGRGKAATKEKAQEAEKIEEPILETSSRRTRTRKQTDNMPPPAPVPAARSTRASSRALSRADTTSEVIPEAPPKRTRTKKKLSEESQKEPEKEKEEQQEPVPTSPAEKPQSKRTRRAQKAAEKEPQKSTEEPPKDIPDSTAEDTTKQEMLIPKQEKISEPPIQTASPILTLNAKFNHSKDKAKLRKKLNSGGSMEETQVISSCIDNNTTVNICNGPMDKTVVLSQGIQDEKQVKSAAMNETVVLEKANPNATVVLETHKAMDATVVLDKAPHGSNMTEDNSLLTDDDSTQENTTPERKTIPKIQPISAVKEKVQQFEEMASRTTRTKTRAMAKKQDEHTDNHTPPDNGSKAALSAETLAKMNSLIFNGKRPQVTKSATKLGTNIVTSTKSQIPSSTSKINGLAKYNREKEEESVSSNVSTVSVKNAKEDARKKKEAMLEAKREAQRRKREEKMAAAAAAREAAERERQQALEAALKGREERQAHADQGRAERMKDAERKKQELARKVAETEERRRAEEKARQLRLAEEQKRAEDLRKRHLDEQEATKKEAALMAKEIEKRQKEYLEKQKLKQLKEVQRVHTPIKANNIRPQPGVEPVYMQDGFEQLNSDNDDDEPPATIPPAWAMPKARLQSLVKQAAVKSRLVDQLFGVRVHCIDLRALFPALRSKELKRTSSAVWNTTPARALARVDE